MKKIYIILFFLFLVQIVKAQDRITGGNMTDQTHAIACPGSTVQYGFIHQGTPYSFYKWRITKGNVSGQTQVCTAPTISVTWDTNMSNDGMLEVFPITGSCNTAISGSPVAVLYIQKYVYPAGFANGGTNACDQAIAPLSCGVAQNISITFWLPVSYSNYNDNLWSAVNSSSTISLPTGWSVNSVTRNTNATCINTDYARVTISVHTDGVHAGNVKFRVKSACDGGYNGYGEWTTSPSLSFPPIDLTQNNPNLIFCNSTSSNTVTVSSTKATSYSWSVPPGYLVNGSGTSATTASNSVTLTSPTATANGAVTVTGLSGSCGNSNPISIPLYFGTQVPGLVSYGVNAPPGRFSISVDPVLNATSYNWYVNAVYKGNTTLPRIVLPINGNLACGNDYYFAAEAVSTCGTSAQSYTLAPDPLACGSGSANFTVYPNPSNSVLNVSYNPTNTASNQSKIKEQASSSDQHNDFSTTLYDDKGKVLLFSSKKNGGTLTMNIQNIPDGIYYLHIKNSNQTIRKPIFIKH